MKFALTKYNNLTQRVITGAIGAGVIISGVYYSEWLFFAIFFFITIMTQLEFYQLIFRDGYIPLKTYGSVSGALIFTLFFFVERGDFPIQYLFLIFPLLSGIYLIKLYKKNEEKPFSNIAMTFLGIIYVAIPISLFSLVAFPVPGQYTHEIIIGIMFILWASDSGAYFAGSRFGKRKLFERISPKKSWEGSLGGAVLAFTVAYILSQYFQTLTQLEWFVVTGLIIVSGTYGDLVESLFKRSIQIKDSGTTLPGHGGFLDRFDSLLIAIPFIITYVRLFK